MAKGSINTLRSFNFILIILFSDLLQEKIKNDEAYSQDVIDYNNIQEELEELKTQEKNLDEEIQDLYANDKADEAEQKRTSYVPLNERRSTLLEARKKLSPYTIFGSDKVRFFFERHLEIWDAFGHMFRNGSGNCFNSGCITLRVNPPEADTIPVSIYSKRFINCLKAFPSWNIHKLAYLCMLFELAEYDRSNKITRDYHQGHVKVLLDDICPTDEYWIDTLTRQRWDAKPKTELLNQWLNEEISFEELFADPLIQTFVELKKAKHPKGKILFKGGTDLNNQYSVFLTFAEKELQKTQEPIPT